MSVCSISSNLIKSLRPSLPYQEVYFHFFHEFSRNRDESSTEHKRPRVVNVEFFELRYIVLKIRAVFHCWVLFQFTEDSRARIRRHCWSRWTSYRTTVPRMSFWITFVHVISLSSRSDFRSTGHEFTFWIRSPLQTRWKEVLKKEHIQSFDPQSWANNLWVR